MAGRTIAVVGGGIGGLTAAVALARQHVRCVVYERHPAPPADGAGIQISPNAVAELTDLGLSAAFDSAVRPVAREIRRWRDNTVLARDRLTGYGAPYCTVRRSALVRTLIDAVRRAHGEPAVQFGRRCAEVRPEDSRVGLRFDDGTVTEADAVIGADGLHSVVRQAIRPDPPWDSGHVAHRAVLPASDLIEPDRVVVWIGPGAHCVAYPIDRGRHLNLVVTTPAGADPVAAYTDWHPVVRSLIGMAGRWDGRPLYDRPPAPGWHRGRVVLIGDAAHPMLPFLAQGAAQAIEDAVTLARYAHEPDGPARYEAERLPRVRRGTDAAHAGLDLHHLPDGPEQRRRDRAMAAAPADAWDWLYRGLRPRARAGATPARPGTTGPASGRSAGGDS